MSVEGKAMKRGSLLGWVGIALLAAATAWVVYTSGGGPAKPAPTATVTPHIIIVPVTVTATPAPTTTPTSRAPVILPPPRTPVNTPSADGTDATRQAPTATATRWAAPTVPWTGEAPTLHVPEAETLFKVVQFAEQEQRGEAYSAGSDVTQSDVIWDEAVALNELVAADVAHHYMGGLPAAGRVLTTPVDLWGWPPDSLMQLLRAAAIRHVLDQAKAIADSGGDSLSGNYSISGVAITVSALEMDGDPGREWLVAVFFQNYHINDWLTFDEDADGQLRYLPAPWSPMYSGHDPVDFDATHDFTGDGRAELVIVAHFYMAGHYWGNGSIYHWRGDGWQLVGTPALPSGPVGWDISSEYVLDDFNRDGRTDFQVTTPNYYGFDCRTDTVITYVWDGLAIVATGSEPPLPETGNCLIYAAEHAGSLAGEARGFERVLTLLEVEGAKPDLLAWAKVQLAMRYTALGSGAEAEALLKAAVQAEGEGGYLDLLRQATAEVGDQPVAVCAWLFHRASQEELFGSLHTDIDDDLSYQGYPMFYELNPEKVCPYAMVLKNILARATLPASTSPAVALEAQGLSLVRFEPLALDGDVEPEYLGVVAGPLGRIVIFDQRGARWQLTDVQANGPATLALAVVDGNGVGVKDLLLSWRIEDPENGWQCAAGEAPVAVILLAGTLDGWALADSNTRCADPAIVDLSEASDQAAAVALLTAPEPVATLVGPAWLRLEGYGGRQTGNNALLWYVDELQTNVLERRYPLGTQAAITALLDYLPSDDANAQLVAVRLLYLRGLGYELAGDDVAAVAAYTDLLRAAPGSAWAWLAWARVGPRG